MKATSASLLMALLLPAFTTVSALPQDSDKPTKDEIIAYYTEYPITNACSNFSFREGHLIDAACLEPYWAPDPASAKDNVGFDLNDCLVNRSGDLQFAQGGGGGYSSSCQSCELTKGVLTCECGRGADRGTKQSTFDLNDCRYFQNVAGTLTCNDVGKACPNPPT